MAAILDAYLQRSMQIELSAMWDKLRERGYKGRLLMIHNSGGIAEVFRTTASRTYNSGPVSGLMGAHHVAKSLGYQNVVMTDMGGTSFDIGLVVEDSVRSYEFRPIIDRWMVGITMIKTLSIGAGGGSIASDKPIASESRAGGPAQRGLDAGTGVLQSGRHRADRHRCGCGARLYQPGLLLRRQDADRQEPRGRRRSGTKIAKPLGISVEEGAALIRKIVNGNMSSAIMKEVHLRGYSPEDFILFVGGGAGATHAEGFKGDIPKAVLFPFSPVFCAYGSSTMDIMHVYEASKKITLMTPGDAAADARLRGVQRDGRRRCWSRRARICPPTASIPKTAAYVLELDMLYGGQFHVKRALSPRLSLHSDEDIRAVCDAFNKEFSEAFSPFVVNPEGGIFIESFILKAIVPRRKFDLPELPLEGKDPSGARKGERPAYWPEEKAFRPTATFTYEVFAPRKRSGRARDCRRAVHHHGGAAGDAIFN